MAKLFVGAWKKNIVWQRGAGGWISTETVLRAMVAWSVSVTRKLLRMEQLDVAGSSRGMFKGIGRKIEKGKTDFEQLQKYATKNGEPKLQSGRQELLENLLNEYI